MNLTQTKYQSVHVGNARRVLTVNISHQTESSNDMNPATKKQDWSTTNVAGMRRLDSLMDMMMFHIQISSVRSSQHRSAQYINTWQRD